MNALRKENYAIGVIENQYMVKKRRNIVCVCEDMDFFWDEDDLNQIPHMWNQGLSAWDIGKSFNRDPDEVAIAIIHLSKKGKIRQRWGGLNGRRKVKP